MTNPGLFEAIRAYKDEHPSEKSLVSDKVRDLVQVAATVRPDEALTSAEIVAILRQLYGIAHADSVRVALRDLIAEGSVAYAGHKGITAIDGRPSNSPSYKWVGGEKP